RYSVRLLPGSEGLFDDGTLVSPVVQGEGEIAVKAKVTGGFPGGRVPPLQFDMANRRIQGKVEFRLVDPTTGRVGTTEDPIGKGNPGDTVSFVVQMRTEVPLNEIYFEVNWRAYALSCEGMESIYANPEEDEVPPGPSNLYVPYRGNDFPLPQCTGIADGRHMAFYRMGGAWSWPERAEGSYPDRIFEYFRPIGDWVDLTRVTLRIPVDAGGGTDIPLTFKPFHRVERGELEYPYPVNFAPYYADWPCNPDEKPVDFLWKYDVNYTNSVVHVLGNDEPPPPPDYGIRIMLGEAQGKPGETVEVPVTASTEVPLYLLRLALEYDPAALRVDAVGINNVVSPIKGPRTEEIVRGQTDAFLDCTEDQDGDGYPDACFEASPLAVQFYQSE